MLEHKNQNLLVYCLNTAKRNLFEFFICRAVSRNL